MTTAHNSKLETSIETRCLIKWQTRVSKLVSNTPPTHCVINTSANMWNDMFHQHVTRHVPRPGRGP